MSNTEYPKVEKEIFNVENENLQKLASLFPSAVKDGQLDINALKEELGQFEEVGQEKYELNWAGKQNAKKEARKNVLGKTLRYIQGDGVNEDTTENLYIEGDNLEVLKLLRKNYYGRIKMIYIDPPYNTDNDFVYDDNFSVTTEEAEQLEGFRDEYGEKLQRCSVTSSKYHTNWLNMMYPRLQLAKDLLTSDGIIFISIDEHEVVNLGKLLDDCVFGKNNNLGTIVWDKRNPKGEVSGVAEQHEYILVYCKDKSAFTEADYFYRDKEHANIMLNKAKQLFNNIGKEIIPPELKQFAKKYSIPMDKLEPYKRLYTLEDVNSDYQDWLKKQDFSGGELAYKYIDENGEVFQPVSMAAPDKPETRSHKPLIHPVTQKPCPVPEKGWRYKDEVMNELVENNRICFGLDETTQPRNKYLLRENLKEAMPSLLYFGGSGSDDTMGLPFDNPKPLYILKKFISSCCYENDIVLDFFSGSATTGHACIELNSEDKADRKFIMVQLPELTYEYKDGKKIAKKNCKDAFIEGFDNICEIGKERIRRAGQKIKEEIEQGNQQLKLGEEPKQVGDIGFKVFRVGETTLNWEKIRLQGKDIVHDYLAGTSDKDKLDFTPDYKNDLNVVYEIMLRQEGLPLTSNIEKLTDIGSRTYLVADSYLISLEETITSDMIEKLSALNPLPIKFVFRDSAFDDNIVLKDETFRKLNALIDKNTSDEKKTYTVEFI